MPELILFLKVIISSLFFCVALTFLIEPPSRPVINLVSSAAGRRAILPNLAQNFESIDVRTRKSLDFPIIVEELQKYARTVVGRGKCSESTSGSFSVANIRDKYSMIEQVKHHIEFLPFQGSLDLEPFLQKVSNNTGLPDGNDLGKFADNLEILQSLQQYIHIKFKTLSLFGDVSNRLKLPSELTSAFKGSFDSDNQLSSLKYPHLKKLRGEIVAQQESIQSSILRLTQDPIIKSKLVDSGYVEVDGRYCILVNSASKRGIGIVHSTSNSGKTSLIEPFVAIEATNQLQELRSQLRREESCIYIEMCAVVHGYMHEIRQSVQAAAELDVLSAKARFGKEINGIIPQVSDEGVIHCLDAKNPILLLRSASRSHHSAVVGNDICLSDGSPALIISGPNAGGKTIVLKTVGLLALMVQHSIPVPVQDGARVDLFRSVLADIGDHQSASADVSTFSGHLLACKAMLDEVKLCSKSHILGGLFPDVSSDASADVCEYGNKGTGLCRSSSLVLLDEVGTGTDPDQGSALAQAVLEELVEAGARTVATTHYQRIKELAAVDPRFQIAGMEFLRSKPTFKLRVGAIGESFALDTAKRMNLPDKVLRRAVSLLTTESRRTAELQLKLQEEIDKASMRESAYIEKVSELSIQQREVEREKQVALDMIQELRESRVEKYLVDLRLKEKELEDMIAHARNISTMSTLSSVEGNNIMRDKVSVESDLQAMRAKLKREKIVTEQAVIATQNTSPSTTLNLNAEPLQPGDRLEAGDELVVLEPGSMLRGARAMVTHRNRGHGRVVVRVAGAEIKMERHLLGVPSYKRRLAMISAEDSQDQLTVKEKKLQRQLRDEMVDPGDCRKRVGGVNDKEILIQSDQVVVVDIKALRTLGEARKMLEESVRALSCGSTMRVVHGGNCTFKDKLRVWLRTLSQVKSVGAASLSQGGDAVTYITAI